mmetsp:Transcript_2169/g.4550  ORF Transcript_2169/g.4550 Transcript_2169/m.4550 type:complete len:278 (-) Transcript_2169:920-1753(-)
MLSLFAFSSFSFFSLAFFSMASLNFCSLSFCSISSLTFFSCSSFSFASFSCNSFFASFSPSVSGFDPSKELRAFFPSFFSSASLATRCFLAGATRSDDDGDGEADGDAFFSSSSSFSSSSVSSFSSFFVFLTLFFLLSFALSLEGDFRFLSLEPRFFCREAERDLRRPLLRLCFSRRSLLRLRRRLLLRLRSRSPPRLAPPRLELRRRLGSRRGELRRTALAGLLCSLATKERLAALGARAGLLSLDATGAGLAFEDTAAATLLLKFCRMSAALAPP